MLYAVVGIGYMRMICGAVCRLCDTEPLGWEADTADQVIVERACDAVSSDSSFVNSDLLYGILSFSVTIS